MAIDVKVKAALIGAQEISFILFGSDSRKLASVLVGVSQNSYSLLLRGFLWPPPGSLHYIRSHVELCSNAKI